MKCREKFLPVILISFLPLAMISCAEEEADEMMEEQEEREEVYEMIITNEEYLSEFVAVASDNEDASSYITGNEAFSEATIQNQTRMNTIMEMYIEACEEDSTICNHLVDVLSNNDNIMQRIRQKERRNNVLDTANTKKTDTTGI